MTLNSSASNCVGATVGQPAAPLATSYDEVPYPPLEFSYTHPSHLATIGRLVGLKPAAVDRCRVLELGCAGGGNLVPMAYTLPKSQFVGIDLSERQIADGRKFAAALRLENVSLEPMDICDAAALLGRRFGKFDYVVAHGIYSWVPDHVKQAMLAACRSLLADQGIAYISYSCYPGCRPRELVRRMCLYHGRNEPGPRALAAKNREFLEFLLTVLPDDDDPYRFVVREQAANLLSQRDSILLHDALERDNDPRLFHEFVADAQQHGLQYCGDAHFSQMVGIGIDAVALEALRSAGGSAVDFQQRLDFLYGRALRSTLLCRVENEVRHQSVPGAVRELWVASAAKMVSPEGKELTSDEISRIEIGDRSRVTFRAKECTTTIAGSVGKAAMLELCAAGPRPIRFGDLVERVRIRLAAAGVARDKANETPLDDQLAESAIRWFAIRLVELMAFEPPMETSPGERPVASAVARYQLADNWEARDPLPRKTDGLGDVSEPDGHYVTDLLHRRTFLEGDFSAQVLWLCDGQHTRREIVELLAAPVLSGQVPLKFDGQQITDAAAVREIFADRTDDCIAKLARNALLVRG